MSDYRVWIACLAAYNNGKLHGKWVDIPWDADELREEIAKVLKTSPEPGAEEWGFHDYDGVGLKGFGENPDLEALCETVEFLETTVYHELAAALLEYDELGRVREKLENGVSGPFRTEADWAIDFLEDTGAMREVPEYLQPYIDHEAYARDARIGGDIDFVRVNGDLYAVNTH